MYKLEFYDRGKQIPLDLCVSVNDRQYGIDYKKCENEFAYFVDVYSWRDNKLFKEEIAKEILKDFINLLIGQSYDHGAQWRKVSIEKIGKQNDNNRFSYKVKFRIKDIY